MPTANACQCPLCHRTVTALTAEFGVCLYCTAVAERNIERWRIGLEFDLKRMEQFDAYYSKRNADLGD